MSKPKRCTTSGPEQPYTSHVNTKAKHTSIDIQKIIPFTYSKYIPEKSLIKPITKRFTPVNFYSRRVFLPMKFFLLFTHKL